MTLSERINAAMAAGIMSADILSPRFSPDRRIIVIADQTVAYPIVGDRPLADAICADEHTSGVIDRALSKVGY